MVCAAAAVVVVLADRTCGFRRRRQTESAGWVAVAEAESKVVAVAAVVLPALAEPRTR